jgi:hypothetical protein
VDALPSLKELGTAGAFYFLNEPRWMARHVETLDILDARSAMRQLTIDVVLPRDPAAHIEQRDGETLYCLPVARLSKDRPTSFIDVVDEDGKTLPLFTREQNARISRRALTVAVRHLLGSTPIDATLGYSLDLLVNTEGAPADIAGAIYKKAARLRNQLGEGPAAERLGDVVLQLQANSMVWMIFRGRPGAHRVLKLRYRIPLQVPVVPERRREEERIEELDYVLSMEGPIDWKKTARNVASRFTAAMGWDAIDLRMQAESQDPESYHLQVRAPTGLQVDEIRPGAIPDDDDTDLYLDRDHLYVRGAPRGQSLDLLVRLSVHRRGLLNLSMLATAAISVLLWVVQAKQEHLTGPADGTNAQITAAVLIVVPALLILFANQLAENALASVLLVGVRTSALLSGLCAAAAAAAVGWVRLTDSLSASLILCASISTISAAAVAGGWIRSSTLLRDRLGRLRRGMWGDRRHRTLRLLLCTPGFVMTGTAAAALAHDPDFLHSHRGSMAVAVFMATAASALWLVASCHSPAAEGEEPPPLPRIFAASLVLSIVCAIAVVIAIASEDTKLLMIVGIGSLVYADAVAIGTLVNALLPLDDLIDPDLLWDETEDAYQLLDELELLPLGDGE